MPAYPREEIEEMIRRWLEVNRGEPRDEEEAAHVAREARDGRDRPAALQERQREHHELDGDEPRDDPEGDGGAEARPRGAACPVWVGLGGCGIGHGAVSDRVVVPWCPRVRGARAGRAAMGRGAFSMVAGEGCPARLP